MLPILINVFLVSVTVVIHYETLRLLTEVLPRLGHTHRYRIVFGVMGALLAHTLEIGLFGLAYFVMIKAGRFGILEGAAENSLYDCNYFSFITYTTVGYGDIAPLGDLRYLASMESLTGLVMITWTASYMFLEMQKMWGRD
jgi:hypothetical protein